MSALLPVDDALNRILKDADPKEKENVALQNASDCILADNVFALRTQPPFSASAMDGYAVRYEDVLQLPTKLEIVGQSIAGQRYSGKVTSRQAVRIFTGAPVPDGADTVVIQENANQLSDVDVQICEHTPKGQNIRPAGLDFEKGELLLRAGRQLDPVALSLAAASNNAYLPVIKTPLVAILSTGNELVLPGEVPGPDQIISSNAYGVAALVKKSGGSVMDLGIVPDDLENISAAIQRAQSAGVDVIITLGGASVGDHDLVGKALISQGMKLDFWRIAMRPGKPLMYGRLGKTHILGLPGNPVSSLVCSHLFVKPLVARLAGLNCEQDIRNAVLGTAMEANQKRRDYVRAIVALAEQQNDRLVATPFQIQDSSMLKTFADANALIIREANAPAAQAGDICKIMLLR